MSARLENWWAGLSGRERVLMGVMGVLLAIVILWLGIARPVESGLKSAQIRLDEAVDRNASIGIKVRQLEKLPRGTSAGMVEPIAQRVGASAGEAGFTLERSQEQGPGRVDIAIASVKPVALFSWIAGLEAQGVSVETLTVQPSGGTGTVSVQALLKDSRR